MPVDKKTNWKGECNAEKQLRIRTEKRRIEHILAEVY